MKYLIDPSNIINFNRDDDQLEAFWLFCVLVAGKNAQIQSRKLAEFLEPANDQGVSPFDYIRELIQVGELDEKIREHKLGQYNRISKCFAQSINVDLRDCHISALENIFGVGPKTSRFFMVYTREHSEYAILDTHILKWIGSNFNVRVPKNTPVGRVYSKLEELFVFYAREVGQSIADLDLSIWKQYNKPIQYTS